MSERDSVITARGRRLRKLPRRVKDPNVNLAGLLQPYSREFISIDAPARVCAAKLYFRTVAAIFAATFVQFVIKTRARAYKRVCGAISKQETPVAYHLQRRRYSAVQRRSRGAQL